LTEHDSFADNPWTNTLVAFVEKVLADDRVRTIGVCYGHQIVARALGMKVGRNDDGWEAAVTNVELSAKGKELFGKDTLVEHSLEFSVPSSDTS
jgi:GMP synthase-like glutamine amidotransferase